MTDRITALRARLDDIRDERHFPAHMLDVHDEMLAVLSEMEHAQDASQAQGEVERLRAALEDVCNPLGYLQRMAEAEGNKLGGMAYTIANDISTVQRIARCALDASPAPGATAQDDRDRQIKTLRRALAWHGDPQRMATTREEWQQEIDDAIAWVKANPEPGRLSFSSFNTPTPPAPVGLDTVAFVQEWLMSSDHPATQWDRDFAAAIEARAAGITGAMVAQMVSRFLAWKLPPDFNPDGGISFKNVFGQCWPVGTNLFTAAQAEEMFRAALASLNPATGAGETEGGK